MRTPPGAANTHYHNHLDDHDTTCRIWPYSTNNCGYGQVSLNGHTHNTHVLACQHRHGPRPTPQHDAAHLCDNRACWNPDHLQWQPRTQRGDWSRQPR
jgi:hypothetical protein